MVLSCDGFAEMQKASAFGPPVSQVYLKVMYTLGPVSYSITGIVDGV